MSCSVRVIGQAYQQHCMSSLFLSSCSVNQYRVQVMDASAAPLVTPIRSRPVASAPMCLTPIKVSHGHKATKWVNTKNFTPQPLKIDKSLVKIVKVLSPPRFKLMKLVVKMTTQSTVQTAKSVFKGHPLSKRELIHGWW